MEALTAPAAPAAAAVLDRGRLALVLSGGGARGAYQVGVLKAIAELLPRDCAAPFRIICGTSAGAITAAVVASHASQFRAGVVNLERVWRNFHVDQVFRADTRSMLRSGSQWLAALLTGGWLIPAPRSVFDNRPLRELLERHVNFARIRQAIDHGSLEALAINAAAYRRALSVAFYESAHESAPWLTAWRRGEPADLSLDHLMASSAVPFLFPPVRMGTEYYGDGAMRQSAPLSPAIRLGADRLLVIGVRPPLGASHDALEIVNRGPSFGQVFGFMLDTLFMDGLHADLERCERDNRLIAAAGGRDCEGLRPIETLLLAPREDFGAIALRHAGELPRPLRVLLRTLGAWNAAGGALLSYLLFEGAYTRELIAIGHADAMARRDELQEFVVSAACRATTPG
ncbi:MAG: patatin-like phospholipase family protein [Proteobacteria bacterium]|nr:patatin-like phospholipase family protein [Pseudomonadota bacterium]